MKSSHNPFDIFFAGAQIAQIAMESQAIIAMRMMGMMGFWATKPQEISRMVAEKPETFLRGWESGMKAAMRGAPPARVFQAAMAPIGAKTGANHKRLTRLGPRLPGQ